MTRRCATGTAALVAAIAVRVMIGQAHKPITSPFTFNEDVFPIVRDRCGACHVAGGPAPMSLMTHQEAMPWGESIRMELMAGQMPPWQIASPPARFRNVAMLSPRELDVLLTWASGGTPPGNLDKTPIPPPREDRWPLGEPDLVLPLPEVTIPADTQAEVREFTLRLENSKGRIRAVDLRPGTPSVVRGARVTVAASPFPRDAVPVETTLALWLPGDRPVPLDDGIGLRVPNGAELVVRLQYRKTWQHEREAMTDRSTLGIYLARDARTDLRALRLPVPSPGGTSSVALDRDLLAVAIYPDPDLDTSGVRVIAVRPDNTRDELIAFRPRAGWARRYWFADRVPLPRGSRLEITAARDDALLLPPGAVAPLTDARGGSPPIVVNVVAAGEP